MSKIKVIKQRLGLLNTSVELLHLFVWLEQYEEYSYMTTYTKEQGIDDVSACIAHAINYYYGDKFEVEYDSENHDCECCGWFTIDRTKITNIETKEYIEIVEDDHMGFGTMGLYDEEVVEDWKSFGYEIEIEYI